MKVLMLVGLMVVLAGSYLKAELFDNSLRIVGTSSKNTQQAKIEAINKGRKDSLIYVISKITSKNSQQKIIDLLNNTKTVFFEKRFSINKEDITNKKYAANAYFVFDEKKIKDFLDTNSIPYVNTRLGRYMIIPSFYDNGVYVADNIWNHYWEKESSDGSLGFLSTFIYYNNLSVVEDKTTILGIKSNLGLDDILLLNLNAEQDNTFTLEIKSIVSGKVKKITGISSIQEATMLAPSEIEEDKKVEILSSYLASSSKQQIRVVASNYADWIFIENKLNEISEVSNFNVVSIYNNFVNVNISLKTNMEELKNILKDECILFDVPSLTLSKISACNG